MGSYEAWAGIAGGVLEAAGMRSFLRNRNARREAADRETQEWLAFCELWWDRYGERPASAGELFDILKSRRLLLDLWAGRTDLAAQQRLGHAVAGRRDRVYGRYTIRAAVGAGLGGNNSYRLEPTGSGHNTLNTENIPQATEGIGARQTVLSSQLAATNVNHREAQHPVSGVSGVFDATAPDEVVTETPEEVNERW
jgi:hypothetical protein